MMADPDHTTFRIIDANLNRARESLRVMEEYTRFGLDDPGLSAAIKETRHALGQAVGHFEAGVGRGTVRGTTTQARGSLIAHREIGTDVGRELRTESEYHRGDALEVALAAGKRLSEALRAVEEYGKVVDANFASVIEQLRYRGYEIERCLALTIRARERFGPVRLYVILTESLCKGNWFSTAEAALRGGADCLQLREKNLSDRELLDRARRLAGLCRKSGKLLIVNDRPDIAAAAGADGVHLGQDDLPVAWARRIMPAGAVVGLSTHTLTQVTAGSREVPDYIAVGPMFATATKPRDQIAGPAMLAAARALTSLPLVAIGGITAENAAQVCLPDPCCLCVCTGVIGQSDAEAAAGRIRAAIDKSACNK